MSFAACIAVLLIILSIIMGFVTFARFRKTRDSAYAVFMAIFMSTAVSLLIALMHFNPQY